MSRERAATAPGSQYSRSVTGQYLTEEHHKRAATVEAAEKVGGEVAENFVTRFPKQRLYRVKDGAPYGETVPGTLILVTDYIYDKITAKPKMEDPEEVSDVRTVMVYHPVKHRWWTIGDNAKAFALSSDYLERVDETDYGVEKFA